MTETDVPTQHRRGKIRKTTITPAPGSDDAPADDAEHSSASPLRVFSNRSGRLAEAREPLPGAGILRTVMTTMLSVLCLLTVGGAILLLLLWQQERDSGVLRTQLDRTWDLFDLLRTIERWIAIAVVPIAMAWIALAVVNVRRATGRRPNPVLAALSLPVGVAGVWYVGRELVEPADGVAATAAAFVLQAVFVLVPLLALLRVAVSAEARHRPMRAAAVIAIILIAIIQFLGALSTVDEQSASGDWARLGAYLVITALVQVLGTLAASEGARAIEEGTEHRYQLRSRFGESVLAQAEL